MQQTQTEVLTLKQVTALSRSMKYASTVLSYRLCEAPTPLTAGTEGLFHP